MTEEVIAKDKGTAEAEEVFEHYYTVKEVASRLKISTAWISFLCLNRRIRAFKPTGGNWRIPKAEAEILFKRGIPPLPRVKAAPAPTVIELADDEVEKVSPPKDESEEGGKQEEKPKRGKWFPLPFDLD